MGIVFQFQSRKKTYVVKIYHTRPPRATAVKVLRDLDRNAVLAILLPVEDGTGEEGDLTAPAEELCEDTDSDEELEQSAMGGGDTMEVTPHMSTIDFEIVESSSDDDESDSGVESD
jgi:hypothetical protein